MKNFRTVAFALALAALTIVQTASQIALAGRTSP